MRSVRLAAAATRHPQLGDVLTSHAHASYRFSSYPQELTIRLDGLYRLSQIQILSHEYKVCAHGVTDDSQLARTVMTSLLMFTDSHQG